ncbi:AI-2E family transporter [Pontibacter roseus]|uniref:AI-2E family transporter n=1 Tax=Pontibacter roseus TaxID=336989 RepID=UPI000367A752|nr:AI-2E family transporter [Pontibacter roseus]
MNNRAKTILLYGTLIVVGSYFLFWGLVQAKSFLAPLTVAALLAMVLLPMARWLEKKGLQRGWSAFLSVLLILLFFAGMAWVMALQLKSLSEDWPKLQKRLEPKLMQLQDFIEEKTGIAVQEQGILNKLPLGDSGSQEQSQSASQEPQQAQQQPQPQQQSQQPQEQQASSQGGGGIIGSVLSTAGSFLMQFFGMMGTFLLTLIYVFFFLLYRSKFKKSILKFVPDDERDAARDIINKSTDVSKDYLLGRLILIAFLAVLYSIGLSLSGVQQAILISVLAAVLTLIPYIGNIIGYALAVGIAVFSGGGLTGAVGVTITFSVAQFVESYILEPYVVGEKVNINPVFTIIVVVLGGAVWGIIGMLIAIPVLGIAKVVFDHIPVLQPLGYLFGQEGMGNDDSGDGFFDKLKRWAMNKSGTKKSA